jgi:hypothetical protein
LPNALPRADGSFNLVWNSDTSVFAQHFKPSGLPYSRASKMPRPTTQMTPVSGAAFPDGSSVVHFELAQGETSTASISATTAWRNMLYGLGTTNLSGSPQIFTDAITSDRALAVWVDDGNGAHIVGVLVDTVGYTTGIFGRQLVRNILGLAGVRKIATGQAALAYCARRTSLKLSCFCLKFIDAEGNATSSEIIVRRFSSASYVAPAAITSNGKGGVLCAYQEITSTGSVVRIVEVSPEGQKTLVASTKLYTKSAGYVAIARSANNSIILAYMDRRDAQSTGLSTFATAYSSVGTVRLGRTFLGQAAPGPTMTIQAIKTGYSSTAIVWLSASSPGASPNVMFRTIRAA